MKSLVRIAALSLSLLLASPLGVASLLPTPQQLSAELKTLISGRDIISLVAPTRWSTFGAPQPAVVINPQNELDVAIVVGLLSTLGIPFLAQNGGNGWATTFDLGPGGVLINLAHLDSVTFNADKTEATIGGGASINQTIAAASQAGALVLTGNCNCVGALGAILGGGYGNLMGKYGFGVDNVISLRLVTPNGHLRTVKPESDPDLFWALRGAGPNYGIVTSAVVKSHPATSAEDLQAWTGALIFTPDKLEQVVQAVQDLTREPDMNIFMYFLSLGSPSNTPAIITTPFLHKGTPTTGRQKFASLFALHPIADTTSVLPYHQWNSAGDSFCVKGFRKPTYSAGIQTLIPSVWRQVWNEFVAFQSRPGAENSGVLLETYSLEKARSFPPESASFPFRNVNFQAISVQWYADPALDGVAQETGRKIRDLWRGEDGLARNSTYINFAHGDEPLEVVYGDSLARLKTIKKRVDPKNRFNQWFNIK